MQKFWLMFASFLLLALVATSISAQYLAAGSQDVDQDELEDYYGAMLANWLANSRQGMQADKRSCIRRGGPCDHRPNDCCPKSSCRCNLWGTNCRCHRLGLFQKWGKKR